MKSIRWRLVIMYITLVFIVMISSGTFIIVSVRIDEMTSARFSLESVAKRIRENIIDDFQPSIENFTEKDSISLPEDSEWHIIYGDTGRTGLTSLTDDPLSYGQYDSQAVISALSGREAFSDYRQYQNKTDRVVTWIELAKPVWINEDNIGLPQYVIYVRMNAERINGSVDRTTVIIAIAIVLALVLAGIIGVLFASTLTGPIRILTAKARELAMGNLNQSIDVASRDEIGQLTESFNDMARELGRSMEDMENEKNKMEIVLYNMTDGVLAYDNNGALIHVNQVARELLNIEDVEINSLEGIFNAISPESGKMEPGNIENFKELTFPIGDKFINATLSPYKNKEGSLEGIIIVLQDITKHRKLDNMRKEFVANVSHEIRTPLTTIKSYTETLIDGAIDQRDIAMEFLDVINSEADRMTLIVQDLLELSSIDNKQLVLNLQETNLTELIKQTAKNNTLTAEKQNKSIIFENPDDVMIANVDSARISQVLNNILSNSIKYSAEGSSVQIYSEENNYYYKIYIKDNGFGIPKEDLRRIFERFYRVDKARSRAMGGTGLGLSIAKEIMLAHGGKISASSELGKGTTIILRLPKIRETNADISS